jgi:hypothetical protein
VEAGAVAKRTVRFTTAQTPTQARVIIETMSGVVDSHREARGRGATGRGGNKKSLACGQRFLRCTRRIH